MWVNINNVINGHNLSKETILFLVYTRLRGWIPTAKPFRYKECKKLEYGNRKQCEWQTLPNYGIDKYGEQILFQ